MSDGSKKLNLDEEQRTELVAYLDGELDDAAAERVRRLLAENEEARREAEELTIAWEALDALDEVRASSDFTKRTLTSIKALAETETLGETEASPFIMRRGVILTGWVVGIVASAVIGFCATNWAMPQKSQDLVRDLELMKQLPKYQRVGSAELLQELKKREIFDGEQ